MNDILAHSSYEFFWEGYANEFGRCSWIDPSEDLDFFGSYIMGVSYNALLFCCGV